MKHLGRHMVEKPNENQCTSIQICSCFSHPIKKKKAVQVFTVQYAHMCTCIHKENKSWHSMKRISNVYQHNKAGLIDELPFSNTEIYFHIIVC